MKRRILVVEDEEKLKRVLELQLVSAGFEVEKAGTAEAALQPSAASIVTRSGLST
jgi:DNA-binding response OmpR family regulator